VSGDILDSLFQLAFAPQKVVQCMFDFALIKAKEDVHGRGLHTGINNAHPFSLHGKDAGNIGRYISFARPSTKGMKREDFSHAVVCLLVDWVDWSNQPKVSREVRLLFQKTV
jgi:hypothetical protein